MVEDNSRKDGLTFALLEGLVVIVLLAVFVANLFPRVVVGTPETRDLFIHLGYPMRLFTIRYVPNIAAQPVFEGRAFLSGLIFNTAILVFGIYLGSVIVRFARRQSERWKRWAALRLNLVGGALTMIVLASANLILYAASPLTFRGWELHFLKGAPFPAVIRDGSLLDVRVYLGLIGTANLIICISIWLAGTIVLSSIIRRISNNGASIHDPHPTKTEETTILPDA